MSEELFTDEGSAKLFQLIHMFQRSALVNLGLIPDMNGEQRYDPAEAKEAIDLLIMLENKTQGNLNDIEMKMFRGVISEIQMQFVQAPAAQRERENATQQSEVAHAGFTSPREGPSEIVSSEEE